MFEKLMKEQFLCRKLKIKKGCNEPEIVKERGVLDKLLDINLKKDFDYFDGILIVKVGNVL